MVTICRSLHGSFFSNMYCSIRQPLISVEVHIKTFFRNSSEVPINVHLVELSCCYTLFITGSPCLSLHLTVHNCCNHRFAFDFFHRSYPSKVECVQCLCIIDELPDLIVGPLYSPHLALLSTVLNVCQQISLPYCSTIYNCCLAAIYNCNCNRILYFPLLYS